MSETMRVVLVRLAECEGNVKELVRRHGKLTDIGRQQALQARGRIADLDVQAWVAADNSACKETISILSEGASARTMQEFSEPPYPEWEGLTLAEVQEKWPTEWESYWNPKAGDAERIIVPGGESLRTTFTRVKLGIDKLFAEFGGRGTVVVCTHGEIVRLLTVGLLGAPLENLFRVRGRNTALTIFKYDGSRAMFDVINDTAHCAAEVMPKDLVDYLGSSQ